jgi:hypothetical protein
LLQEPLISSHSTLLSLLGLPSSLRHLLLVTTFVKELELIAQWGGIRILFAYVFQTPAHLNHVVGKGISFCSNAI